MSQTVQVITDLSNNTSGSSGGFGWGISPFSGSTTFAEAISLIGGRQMQVNFIADGTLFCEYHGQLAPLDPPGAGDCILTAEYQCPIDGDIGIYNGLDDSLVFLDGMNPSGSPETMDHILTSGEKAAVISWSNLYVRLYQADDSGTNSGTGFVDYVSFTVPDGAPPQQIRPDADVATTGWTTAPLWSKVEETSPDGTVIVGSFS